MLSLGDMSRTRLMSLWLKNLSNLLVFHAIIPQFTWMIKSIKFSIVSTHSYLCPYEKFSVLIQLFQVFTNVLLFNRRCHNTPLIASDTCIRPKAVNCMGSMGSIFFSWIKIIEINQAVRVQLTWTDLVQSKGVFLLTFTSEIYYENSKECRYGSDVINQWDWRTWLSVPDQKQIETNP